MKIIPPGSTIGILGGGQLGRMTAMAAARLGYKCHIFCPESDAPALHVTAMHTKGDFNDHVTLKRFASSVDVVTLEWENVPLQSVEIISAIKPMHPHALVLQVAQDRGLEKSFARQIGVGTADFALINSAEDLRAQLSNFAPAAILKSSRMGYDGKGQVKVTQHTDCAEAWAAIGGKSGILEELIDFECEISVIVARREDGEMAAYPAVENIHRDHILAETHAPARIKQGIAEEAEFLARNMADKLKVVGLLSVEMFVLKNPDANGNSVIMNEIAPRPHNSGHWTIDACACSQFEQLVRAICGLPLGSTTPHTNAVMYNLLGDEILGCSEMLENPHACLHIYGKNTHSKGRKMGHVTILEEST